MSGQRPRFVKPGEDESLYPARSRDGMIETLINPNAESALAIDSDSRTDFVYNRYHHLPLEAQRQKLPIFQYRNHILYLLEKYQTLVLIGETGCGKSTQVPQYALEVGHRVCVTQPCAGAAVSLCGRVRAERGEAEGGAVGAVAARVSMKTPHTRLVFMTEGVLLREMFASPLLMQYSCIILDEVHQRSQMTDVLMGLLKKIAKKRKNLKIILSSATMDAEFLRDFFNLNADKKERDGSTSFIMSMQGRMHPVDLFYTEEPVPDYVKASVDTVIKIHENEPFGDILVFLTSREEIHTAMELLQPYVEQNNESVKYKKYFPSGIQTSTLSVLPLYGGLPVYKQIKVFQQKDANVRRVVLATNIAENSVTIQGVVYVIDCGYHKLPCFSAAAAVDCVCVTPIAQSNAVQRAGRAGRTARGKCYRLYTEAEYDKLLPSVPPEMCRSDLSAILLQLKALGISNVLKFTFPTPPPAKTLLAAVETLYALRAINRQGDLTSDVGVNMAELPLNPLCAKMISHSGEYGCLDEALSIVTMLQVDSVFIKPSSGKESMAARISRRNNFEVAEGDIIMYLNIMDSYLKVMSSHSDEKKAKKACKAWCQKMYLNHRVMEKAYEIRTSLEKLVKNKLNIENKKIEGIDLGLAKTERVMKSVLTGFFPRAAYLSIDGSYRGVRGAQLHISPDSCLSALQRPQWVIFGSVESSGDKTLMRDMMTIKKEWLLEIAPHFYKEV